MIITFLNNLLLQLGDALGIDFDTEISSCQHDSVRCFNNLIDIVQTFLRLNFRDNLHLRTGFINKRANLSYRIRGTNEGSCNKVKIFRYTELNILYIFIGNGWKLNGHTGYIHSLSLSQLSSVCHLTKNFYTLYSFYL